MHEWMPKLMQGVPLTAREAERAFGRLMEGAASPVEMATFLVALRMRGETPSEVAGGVRALRREMVALELPGDDVVDTCGTGGGSLTTFNISTAAALVAAGGGVRVAKHGNRSYTSRCGSADLLEALGVRLDLEPEELPRVFEGAGFVFMFAPRMHPAMRHVAPVRRELGISTIFNLLGPLTSPARVRRQVVGVSRPELIRLVADALKELGHARAMVVHGEPGMDELSPLGATRVALLDRGEVRELEVEASEFGWDGFEAEELRGGVPEENARLVEEVLRGRRGGAARAAVVLNAAAAFYVAGEADDLGEGLERARASIDGGRAWETVERLRRLTRREDRKGD